MTHAPWGRKEPAGWSSAPSLAPAALAGMSPGSARPAQAPCLLTVTSQYANMKWGPPGIKPNGRGEEWRDEERKKQQLEVRAVGREGPGGHGAFKSPNQLCWLSCCQCLFPIQNRAAGQILPGLLYLLGFRQRQMEAMYLCVPVQLLRMYQNIPESITVDSGDLLDPTPSWSCLFPVAHSTQHSKGSRAPGLG